MKKYLYILSIILLASCSKDDDPILNPEDQAFIYTEVINKGQYDTEYGTENWEYMYLAWDEDRSCFAYNRWIAFCVGINQIAYGLWREIFWSSPGLNSDPDYVIFSNTLYDLEADTTSIDCNNNLGEQMFIQDITLLINNGDYVITN